MNTRIPLPDWRDNIRSLPIAAITEQGIRRISEGKDAIAQRAVEHVAASDRKQISRFGDEQ